MDKTKLVELVRSGCWAVAKNRARTLAQAQDFMGEAMLASLEVIERYPEKKEEDLLKLIGRSAINRITQAQRREAVVGHYFSGQPVDDRDASNEDVEKKYEDLDFVRVLFSRLSIVQRRILREKYNPSHVTMQSIQEEKDRKKKARDNGELVMSIYSNEVKLDHIAAAVGLSKATVSRQFNAIRLTAEELRGGTP